MNKSIDYIVQGHKVTVEFEPVLYPQAFDEENWNCEAGEVSVELTVDGKKLKGHYALQGDGSGEAHGRYKLAPFSGFDVEIEILDDDEDSFREFIEEVCNDAFPIFISFLKTEIINFKGDLPDMSWYDQHGNLFSDAIEAHDNK